MPTIQDILKEANFPRPEFFNDLLMRLPSSPTEVSWQARWFLHGDSPILHPMRAFIGQPDLTLIVPNTLGDPVTLLSAAQEDSSSVLFLEDPRLYPCEMLMAGQGDLLNWQVEHDGARYPTFTLKPEYPPAVTLATYGYNFELTRTAAMELVMQREIFCEIVLFSQLSPVELAPLAASLASTRRLITIEAEPLAFGWGAEIIARAAALDLRRLKLRRVALPSIAPPPAHTEIVSTVLEMLGQKIR